MPKHCWHIAGHPEPSSYDDVVNAGFGLYVALSGLSGEPKTYYWTCCHCGEPLTRIGAREAARVAGHGPHAGLTVWVEDRSQFDGECPARAVDA